MARKVGVQTLAKYYANPRNETSFEGFFTGLYQNSKFWIGQHPKFYHTDYSKIKMTSCLPTTAQYLLITKEPLSYLKDRRIATDYEEVWMKVFSVSWQKESTFHGYGTLCARIFS